MAEAMVLSAAGEARRQAMQRMLMTAVVARRRRRRAWRAAVAVLLVGFGAWLWSGRQADPAPLPVARVPDLPEAPRAVAVFGDDPTVLARLSIAAPVSRVQLVDDGELLQLLQRDGVAAGLVRSGGRAEVLPHVGLDWLAQQ